eukprot:4320758-Pleurochrysis_carterae.AAC.1
MLINSPPGTARSPARPRLHLQRHTSAAARRALTRCHRNVFSAVMKFRKCTAITEWHSHLCMQLFALSAVLLTEAAAAHVTTASAADTAVLNRRRTQFPFPQPIVSPSPELEPLTFPTPPLMPPSPPTLPPAQPYPPLPPAPPMFAYADSTAVLRAAVTGDAFLSPSTQLILLEQRYFFGGTAINISNANITIVGQGLGAILDAEYVSRHFLVDRGAALTLRNIKLVSGKVLPTINALVT